MEDQDQPGVIVANVSLIGYPNESMPDYDYEASFDVLFYHYLWGYVVPIIFALVITAGVTGNVLVLYVILTQVHMRTHTNLLLVNLACADLSFLLIGAPMTAYKYAAATWGLGQIVCKVSMYFTYVPACVTVYTLVAISAQRYVLIVNSSSRRLQSPRSTVMLSSFIWVVMLGLNAPELFIHRVNSLGTYQYCGLMPEAITPLFAAFFLVAYALPLCLICVLYLLIMGHLRRKRLSCASNAQERTAHVARVVTTVVLVFGVSWLPLHVQSLVALVTRLPDGAWYELLRILWNCMAYGNSCANPFIYTFVSREFRKAFRQAVCCTRGSGRRYTMTDARYNTEMTNMVTDNNGCALWGHQALGPAGSGPAFLTTSTANLGGYPTQLILILTHA